MKKSGVDLDGPRFSRTAFLGGAAAIASCGFNTIVDDEHARRAHSMLSGQPPAPSQFRRLGVGIVGGGVAGLSAGWWLQRCGRSDFEIFELDVRPGGNSTWGENEVSAYPWGAHYLPLPGVEARYVRALLAEVGAIVAYRAGQPVYDDWMICRDPQERLYFRGAWQEGIVPDQALRAEERTEMERFQSQMQQFRTARGHDGRKAFCIPLDESSRDSRYTDLDAMSMAEYLKRQGFHSGPLLWYVDYCCRDDYGSDLETTSAWAGVHYFAARGGSSANGRTDSVLTWPEGNGWLVRRLAEKAGKHLRTGQLVRRVQQLRGAALVLVQDLDSGVVSEVTCDSLIFCAPSFVASRLIAELPARHVPQFSPWLIANVTLDRVPAGSGALAWDNVRCGGKGLGYVNAMHQSDRHRRETVITYYMPLVHESAREARLDASRRTHVDWTRLVVQELEAMHPGIQSSIREMKIRLLGHGMVRPVPGFIWGYERQTMLRRFGSIVFANSDMSGISNFEEAQYRGVEAARQIIGGVS